MSAGQALGGIGGAIIGFVTGGPAGAVKGAYWGYMAGTVIDPPPGPHIDGPRLNDRVIQTSEDGAPLATVFGTVRLAGNVIWSTGLEEVATTTEQGGGSGGGGATFTNYSYKTDAAIALCAGEITGVRRIWADAKLIYDVSEASDLNTLLASSQLFDSIRVYTGSETQDPDPLIQAVEGAANTPAFRGMAYVVFEDLQLADFGNRLPNFSFEVVEAAVTNLLGRVSYNYPNSSSILNGAIGDYADGEIRLRASGSNVTTRYTTDGVLTGYGLVSDDEYAKEVVATYPGPYYRELLGYVGGYNVYVDLDLLTSASGRAVCLYDKSVTQLNVGTALYDLTGLLPTGYWVCSAIVDANREYIYVEITNVQRPAAGGGNAELWYILDIANKAVYKNGTLPPNDTISSGATLGLSGGGMRCIRIDVENLIIIKAYGAGTGNITAYDLSSGVRTVLFDLYSGNGLLYWTFVNTSVTLLQKAGVAIVTSGSYDQFIVIKYLHNTLSQSSTDLIDVVADILNKSGLDASEYDMTALSSDVVRGYTVGKPMSARAALEPLQTAYHFDLTEVDGKIKAVKRGGAVVATILDDDLGASESPDGVKLKLTRHNESELPSEIQISYSDIDNDHQAGTQYARSLTAQVTNIQQISLPLAMTSEEAAQLAEVILNSARYTGRHTLEFSLSYAWSRLTPSDVVSVPGYGVQWTARIGQVDIGMPGLVQCQASPEIAALYASILAGSDPTGIGQAIGLTGTTTLTLLDCCMLRDTDTDMAWYAALTGSVDTWPGGEAYKSNDSGATWTLATAATRTMSAKLGAATAALPNADCRVWDKTNRLNVRLQAGATLSSATEVSVLNGANAALLGAHGRWELIQWQNATLEADGTWTLSDLLRGRKGTEHAAGSHASGDVFIVPESTALQQIDVSSSELNANRQFKALTNGQALEAVDAATATYTGERLKPLAPVLFNALAQPDGGASLKWSRRNRIAIAWSSSSALAQSEETESYEIDIVVSGDVVRTLSSASESVAYQQTLVADDTGGSAAVVTCNLYQISATVGRGRVATATFTSIVQAVNPVTPDPVAPTTPPETTVPPTIVTPGYPWFVKGHNGTNFYGINSSGTFGTSADGSSWTTGGATGLSWQSRVVYGHSSTYAAESRNSSFAFARALKCSANSGATWAAATADTFNNSGYPNGGLVYDGSNFIFHYGAYVYSSGDASFFDFCDLVTSSYSSPPIAYGLWFLNGKYFCGRSYANNTGEELWYSSTAEFSDPVLAVSSWALCAGSGISESPAYSDMRIKDLAYGGGVYVAVGVKGDSAAGKNNVGFIKTSANGTSWSDVSLPSGTVSGEFLTTVVWVSGLSLFVAGGRNVAFTSADGSTWTKYGYSNKLFSDFVTDGTRIIARISDEDSSISEVPTIASDMAYSTDGSTWTNY